MLQSTQSLRTGAVWWEGLRMAREHLFPGQNGDPDWINCYFLPNIFRP